MTEAVWQTFVKGYSENEVENSVLLSKYPTVPANLAGTDDGILRNVETARELISLGLKLRNEKQIKVRQPLPTMYVSATETNHAAIGAFGAVILSEMNVGEIKELEDTSALESNYLTVNFKVAGRVLKAQANPVKAYLASLDDETQQTLADKVSKGEAISIESLGLSDIPADVFTVESKSKGSIAVHKDADGFVALDCEISEELMRAGICRDIVRQCQVFRKNAGFDVSDRIYVQFVTDAELLASVIDEKKEQLASDLLATFAEVKEPEFTGEIDLDGAKLTVLLRRV